MKANDLARALRQLADLLDAGPNVDLKRLEFAQRDRESAFPNSAIAVNLSTLAALAAVDKQQWLGLIRAYSFPIDVRPRDASRDILGKLLAFLESHPTARETLKKSPASAAVSPELQSALRSLLGT